MSQSTLTQTCTLSARITKLAKRLLRQHFRKSNVLGLLLATDGEVDDDMLKTLLIKKWKMACDLRDSFNALFESGLNRAESDEEIRLFTELIEQSKSMSDTKYAMLKLKCGLVSDELMSSLVSRPTWLLTQHIIKYATNSTINELIVITFTMILFRNEARNTLICSKFKPNIYTEVWFSDDLTLFLARFTLLIDAKQSKITTDEEKHLIDLVKQTIAYTHVCIHSTCLYRNHILSNK